MTKLEAWYGEVKNMACNCKDFQQEIDEGKKNFEELRELFIKRMTIDSDHNDRRRKDYNQAIFHFEDDDAIDDCNRDCEKYGLSPKEYGATYQVWNNMNMDMVLQCFDDAVKDWRKSWCDVKNCNRK